MADRKSSIPTKAASSPVTILPAPEAAWRHDQHGRQGPLHGRHGLLHGRQGPLHGQHLRRAAVAQSQIRGGLPQCLATVAENGCRSTYAVQPGPFLTNIYVEADTQIGNWAPNC